MSYAQLKQRLDSGEVIVLDGATGTELQRRGAHMSPEAWCGPASLEANSTPIHGGVSLDVARMDKVVRVDQSDLDCTVQP
ncbi:MAG: hypothetical protein ACKOQZ_03380, partial [Actinomycetota bacterium]